jgi:rhodanese-related sulfurtransferase
VPAVTLARSNESEAVMTQIVERRARVLAVGIAIVLAITAWMANLQHADARPAYEPSSRFNVREVDAAQASSLIGAGAIVIDMRSREAFDGGHVAGAINIPMARLRTLLPDDPAFDRAQPIIIYSADASLGAEGTAIMNDAGFSGALSLRGGVDAWMRAGLPTEKPGA